MFQNKIYKQKYNNFLGKLNSMYSNNLIMLDKIK